MIHTSLEIIKNIYRIIYKKLKEELKKLQDKKSQGGMKLKSQLGKCRKNVVNRI